MKKVRKVRKEKLRSLDEYVSNPIFQRLYYLIFYSSTVEEEEENEPGLLNAVEMGVPPQAMGAPLPPTAGVNGSSSASNTYTTTLTCLHCRKSFKPSANQRGDCQMAPNDR